MDVCVAKEEAQPRRAEIKREREKMGEDYGDVEEAAALFS